MGNITHSKMSEYQLRHAAGKYWLLRMEQKGIPYERPLQLNAIAAELWTLFQTEKTKEQIIESLAKKYEVTEAEIREDMQAFCRQLNTLGISTKE